MWILYQASLAIALVAAAPFLLLTRGRHYLPTLTPRLGLRRRSPDPSPLWVHAVSVGEIGVFGALLRTLEQRLCDGPRLVLTTVTPTGQERARATLSRSALAARAQADYLPFDLSPPISRFIRAYRPELLVLVEGDYWPLLLRCLQRRGTPVVVINGRISDRSYARLLRLRRFTKPLFEPISRFGMQTEVDRERLIELGVPADTIEVTGNLKFESPEPEGNPELEEAVRRLAAERPILVAGSTMPNEEEQVLEAFGSAAHERGALLILAPRHPERFDRVAQLAEATAMHTLRRSGLRSAGRTDGLHRSRPTVLLLDSLGELGGIYRLARGAFIGGTLVPRGGHNPLEAARFGVPVAVGPSMANFREIAEAFDRTGAWRRVADSHQLAAVFASWLDDDRDAADLGARGRELIETNRGALANTMRLLEPFLRQLGRSTP